jgi:phosphoglycolate phosphatase-like HAD superfamily hydrolase
MIKAVLFDVIGTTINENDPDTINKCFQKAFTDNGFSVTLDTVRKNRGKSKLEIIETILKLSGGDLSISETISNDFRDNVKANIGNFVMKPGAVEILEYLRANGIKTGLGSGLTRDLFDDILKNAGLSEKLFDYIGIASELGFSRPNPAMINDMISKLSIAGSREFLKVGDTEVDILEGKNAGVITAILLSGTQSRESLEKSKPDYFLNELLEIKEIVKKY